MTMNTNVKEVRFGTKQEAVVTPKMGYALERVEVINTADNSIVPSELHKTSDSPMQYVCTFLQPAGHVTIKPIVKPILYSVTIEAHEECNIVLVETDSPADIEIKNAIVHEEKTPEEVEAKAESREDFNQPQHSSDTHIEQGLDVGEEDLKPEVVDLMPENISMPEPDAEEADAVEDIPDDSAASQPVECAVRLEDDEDDDEDDEPIFISQAEYDKKMELYWKWREAADRGECTKEKFDEIKKLHIEFTDKITKGKIIIQ